MLHITLSLVLLLVNEGHARLRYSSVPEDTYAFPKLRVNFLNQYPVSSSIAQSWLSDGLKGGMLEFLGPDASRLWPEIDTGDESTNQANTQPVLQRMRLGPQRSFACLIPPISAPRSNQQSQSTETEDSIDPLKSWSLLQPLTGGCLYHRQGWFTYAYCHNSYVRQFRELEHSHPHPPGGRIPQEDPDYEAYTLGHAPEVINQLEGEMTLHNDRHQPPDALQLTQGSGQRYLTSKWTDGTQCDKTGRLREVEIQFHCGMTTTDMIQFIKETSLCKYLLVIHTPRLCGEPGFKSARDFAASTPIQCREILDDKTLDDQGAMRDIKVGDAESAWPQNVELRNPLHTPDLSKQQMKKAALKNEKIVLPPAHGDTKHADTLRKLVKQLWKNGHAGGGAGAAGRGPPGAAGGAGPAAAAGGAVAVEEFNFNDLGNMEDGVEMTIRGQDGEELQIQILDIDGVAGEDREDLMNRIQAALKDVSYIETAEERKRRMAKEDNEKKSNKQNKGKVAQQKQQQQQENHDDEEDPYSDGTMYDTDWEP